MIRQSQDNGLLTCRVIASCNLRSGNVAFTGVSAQAGISMCGKASQIHEDVRSLHISNACDDGDLDDGDL